MHIWIIKALYHKLSEQVPEISTNSIVNPSEPGVLLFWNLISASAHSFIVNGPSHLSVSSLLSVLRLTDSKKCLKFSISGEVFF